ncbi:MAG: membrane protein insertion efficiency factor YidD [Parachlamydiaceae bacterium]|nr:membrane protein insertion efficiency factor YidD [Parachlamydiaceae bacterium]
MIKKIFVFLIRIYQYTISPLIGKVCRFEPSCSQYAVDTIKKDGACKGSWRALKRICKCHPWHPGGFDPP